MLRYRSVWTSISIFVYFDIEAPLLNIVPYHIRRRTWSTYIELEAMRYRSLKTSIQTSISKCTRIEYRTWYWSTSMIKKFINFDIEIVYAISKIFQKLRYRSQHFDIVSQTIWNPVHLVYGGTYRYVPVRTCMYCSIAHTGTYFWKILHDCTYQYVLVRTGIEKL